MYHPCQILNLGLWTKYLQAIKMFSAGDTAKRKLQLKKLKEWEISINTISEGSAKITVENEVDLEGPPSNMTYINEVKPAPGITIPNDPPMGCECKGKAFMFSYKIFSALTLRFVCFNRASANVLFEW